MLNSRMPFIQIKNKHLLARNLIHWVKATTIMPGAGAAVVFGNGRVKCDCDHNIVPSYRGRNSLKRGHTGVDDFRCLPCRRSSINFDSVLSRALDTISFQSDVEIQSALLQHVFDEDLTYRTAGAPWLVYTWVSGSRCAVGERKFCHFRVYRLIFWNIDLCRRRVARLTSATRYRIYVTAEIGDLATHVSTEYLLLRIALNGETTCTVWYYVL